MDPGCGRHRACASAGRRTSRAADRRRRASGRPAPPPRRTARPGCAARGAGSRAGKPAGSVGSSAARATRTARARTRATPPARARCISAVRCASRPVTAAITASSPVAPGSETRRSTSRVRRSWLHSHRSASLAMASWTTTTLAASVAVELDVERPGHTGYLLEPGRAEVDGQRHVRVLARVELTDQLGDHPTADEHRRVRLLDAQRVHVAAVRRQLGQARSTRVAGDDGVTATSGTPAQRSGRHDAGSLGHAHGVDDGAAVLEDRDQRAGAHLLHVDGPRLGRVQQRHRVAVVVALRERRAHDDEGHVVVEGDDVVDGDVADGRPFAGEPAPLGQPAPEQAAEDGPPAGEVGPQQWHTDGTRRLGADVDGGAAGVDGEPEEAVRRERQRVRPVADRREPGLPEHLDRHGAGELAQVEVDLLGQAGQVGHAQQRPLVAGHVGRGCSDERQHVVVLGLEELDRPPAEHEVALAQGDQLAHPRQQRRGVGRLGLHVDALVVVALLGDQRQVEAVRVGRGEAGVAVGRPLHRRAHAVAVAEVDVVAHPDLVAVVDDRRAGQREQQRVEQLDLASVVAEQRRQAPADAEVDAHLGVGGVGPQHQVALLVGDHLERQLVVVAQERRPLAAGRGLGGLLQDVHDRRAVLQAQRHEQPRHHREVEVHVALVAVAEVRRRVLGPLVGLGQQHAVRVAGVHVLAQPLEDLVGLGQVLAVGALALVEVRHGVEAQAVDAHVEPEVERRR